MNDNAINQMGELLKVMVECDPKVLGAALALVPDFSPKGAEAIFLATVRIAAEHYAGDTDGFLNGMRMLITEARKTMDEEAMESACNSCGKL